VGYVNHSGKLVYCLWFKNPEKTTWDVENHVNTGIHYQLAVAGFLSSTVGMEHGPFE